MKLRESFSKKFRRKDVKTEQVLGEGIICKDNQIENIINEWCDWNFMQLSDFKHVLESIELDLPVTLEECNKEKKLFKCVTENGKVVQVILGNNCYNIFGKNEICIKENEKTRVYVVKMRWEHGVIKHKIKLKKREICKNEKKLEAYYFDNIYYCMLKFSDNYVLRIDIAKEMSGRDGKIIEEYIINLDNSLMVDTVSIYQNIITLLKLSSLSISSMKEFKISYEEIIRGKNRVRSLIYVSRSELIEYAYIENGQTYHLCKNGECIFISEDKIIVSYNIYTCNIDIESSREELRLNTSINELVKSVIITFDRAYEINKEFFKN